MFTPRPYQSQAVAAIMATLREGKNPLLTACTGSGKTEVFFLVCQEFLQWKPSARICIVLNRVRLLDQTIARILKVFPDHMVGVVCGTRKARTGHKQITIGTIQSLKAKEYDLVIVDEAHRAGIDNKQYGSFLSTQKLVLGVTATPWRNDGYIYGKDKLWPSVTYSKPIIEMINEGWLVPPICKKTNTEFDLSGIKTVMGDYDQSQLSLRVNESAKIDSQVTEALKSLEGRKSVAWICVNIDHADKVANALTEKGEPCVLIHSNLTDDENTYNINQFTSGAIRHSVSVSMITEGFDAPIVDSIVMMRPTKSSSLWVQCAGRALRLFPEKKNALILDFGKVIENCGPLSAPIVRKGKSVLSPVSAPMKFCSSCLSYIAASYRNCPDCDYLFPAPEPLKNLTRTASDLDPLNISKSFEWIEVNPIVRIDIHTGKKARCIRIKYEPKNIFSESIYDWAFQWNVKEKFKRIGIEGVNYFIDAEKYIKTSRRTNIKKILVEKKGQYKEIVEVENGI